MFDLLLGFYAYCKAYKSFFVPGIGQAVRVQVTRRQMYFVLITLICNLPAICVEAYIGISIDWYKQDPTEVEHLKQLHGRYLEELKLSCSFWILLLTISDPFTYQILKSKLVCSSKTKKGKLQRTKSAVKRRDNRLKEAEIKSGSMQMYL